MDTRLQWFERLYDAHADALWRHLYLRLGNAERAKELMHEVFLKTWQQVILGKTIEHEKAFLYTIAKNLFINEIRTNKQTVPLDILIEMQHSALADPHANTASEAEHHELMERLSTLKDSYRAVLILRYVDDLAVKEIADILGEHETTISMRIKRGIEALKATYEPPTSSSP